MKNKLLCLSIIGFGVLAGTAIIGTAFAQTATSANGVDIKYPIAELGNCQSKEACKKYCDDSTHTQACIMYAGENNLMSKSDIDIAQKFLNAGSKGPGGCTSQESCKTYCNDMSRIDECVSFAEKAGILSSQELGEAKQVQAAIAKGIQPPACKNKKECDAYCDSPGNMKVCVAFGEASGFLKGKELEDAKKMMTAIDKGAIPPSCKGKEACDAYCSSPEHIEACMVFSEAAGLMSPEEAQNSQKMIAAVKKGFKPPPCGGKEACDAYCAEEQHVDECINFSVAAGFMSEKDAAMAKKTKGKGPGGCTGKDQCDAFCNNPDNQQTCFNFAKENGMIPQEDLKRMEEGQKQFQQSMQNLSSEAADCLKTVVGNEMFEKMKNGKAVPPKEAGEKMGQCFSNMAPPQGQAGQAGGGSGFPPISDMSQEARDCVKSAIGENAFGQIQSESIKNEDKMKLFEQAKSCFENFSPKNQESPQGQGQQGQQGQAGQAGGGTGFPSISDMPQEARECIKSAIGESAFGQIQSSSVKNENKAKLFEQAKNCFGNFNPNQQMPSQRMMPGNTFASGTGPNMPPGDQYVPKIIAPQASEQKMMIDNQFAPGTGPNMQKLPQQEIMPGNQLAPGTAPGTPQQPFIQQSPLQPEPQATPPTSFNSRSRNLFGSVFEVFISAFGL